MKQHLNDELIELMRHGWPESTVRGVEELEATLDRDGELAAEFDPIVSRFAETGELSLREALLEVQELCSRRGLNTYSYELLLIANGLPFLHRKYQERGIPDRIFYASMDDIRCKVAECVECKGVVGTFVAGWYDGFFELTRFAYGRFQYELAGYGEEDVQLSCGKTLKRGGQFLNFHIPSSGVPLTDEVRLASYREAYPHYADQFEDGIVIFGCYSWLLNPDHRIFLPERLNIRRFMDDFEVIKGRTEDHFGDKWRVFGRYASLPANELPRDTALRAAYADWLASGRPTSEGLGFFAFDGDKIIK